MKTQFLSTTILIIIFSLQPDTSFSCSCIPKASTEISLAKSAIVVQGKMIGADTVFRSNAFTTTTRHEGIRVGRQYLIADTQRYVRVKFLIQKKFKSTSMLPDTIFVLTNDPIQDACGFPFMPYFATGTISDEFYEYIIYAESWFDKKLVNISKKGRRYYGEMQSTLSDDTFFTSTCMRTQPTNQEELDRLIKIIE